MMVVSIRLEDGLSTCVVGQAQMTLPSPLESQAL